MVKMDGKIVKIEDVENKLNGLKEEGFGFRMQTNPYNPNVVVIDFAKNEEWDMDNNILLENLTKKTEARILAFSDERLHERNW